MGVHKTTLIDSSIDQAQLTANSPGSDPTAFVMPEPLVLSLPNTELADHQAKLEDRYFETLKDLCRNGSMSRMKSHSRADYLVTSDWPEAQENCEDSGEWLSVIFVKSAAIKVLFKTHYNSKEVRQWVVRAMGVDIQDVTQSMCQDFIKEFCNLSAGLIKTAFQESHESRISLPLVTRGSDGVFFSSGYSSGCSSDYEGGKEIFEHRWVIGDLESQIFCSVEIDIHDSKSIEKLLLRGFGGGDDSGDVEFF